uniref:MARVEL domain-containing protein n=1 Tax=Globodera rostochiensis TaxID=31243 RepID=A0A914I6M3_GLORO
MTNRRPPSPGGATAGAKMTFTKHLHRPRCFVGFTKQRKQFVVFYFGHWKLNGGRRDFYTRQHPDTGHIVTTTVQTKYLDRSPPRNGSSRHRNELYAGDEEYYGCAPGELNTRHCSSPAGILRIIQIVISLFVICLITSVFGPGPFKGILFGQTFIMLFVGISLCLTFIFLIVHFFTLHQSHLNFWPWAESDFLFSTLAAVIFLICSFIEGYYSTGAWSNNCNDIGGDGVIHNGCRLIWEWAFAAFLLFALCVLYAFSAFFANRQKDEERRVYLRERVTRNIGR